MIIAHVYALIAFVLIPLAVLAFWLGCLINDRRYERHVSEALDVVDGFDHVTWERKIK